MTKKSAKSTERLERLAKIRTMRDVLDYAEPKKKPTSKGPYGTALSTGLAMFFANQLRGDFPGVLPRQDGGGHESRARTAKGFKKLDVNYSTLELGLALGISIKTINSRDPETERYTKNYSRVDNELRAEAMDYHQRQPFAVLIGVLFLPIDACDDAGIGRGDESGISSFGAAVKYFRNRTPRPKPADAPDMFERFFVALYNADEPKRGEVCFYDVGRERPPRARRPAPSETIAIADVIQQVKSTYDERNNPPFAWG